MFKYMYVCIYILLHFFQTKYFLFKHIKNCLNKNNSVWKGGGVIQSDALNNDFVNAILEPNLF